MRPSEVVRQASRLLDDELFDERRRMADEQFRAPARATLCGPILDVQRPYLDLRAWELLREHVRLAHHVEQLAQGGYWTDEESIFTP